MHGINDGSKPALKGCRAARMSNFSAARYG